MFLPILLFNVLLVLSESAPWQQKKAALVPKEDDVPLSKCRDGREGIQIEDVKKRDLSAGDKLGIAMFLALVMEKCPYEVLPFIEHCNAELSKDDMYFCLLNGFLVLFDVDEDKCAEKREFPGSQFPGSQFPGSQFPGSQFPAEEFHGAQFPVAQGLALHPIDNHHHVGIWSALPVDELCAESEPKCRQINSFELAALTPGRCMDSNANAR
uniref:Uncharacterized protein n=1 Tax=Globodera rostochiensis TaxID=31243 RepID=A0A914HQC3_GLORO